MKLPISLIICMLLLTVSSWAGEKSPEWDELSFRDADGDGRNDQFRDENGDVTVCKFIDDDHADKGHIMGVKIIANASNK